MASRSPRGRKPPEQLRRRNAPETFVVLPADGCTLPPPKWPLGDATPGERDLWTVLWALPIAAWWHEQRIAATVVARYVSLAIKKPEHATVGQLERELGLTPAAMQRMRLIVEAAPELVQADTPDPYQHLKGKTQ